MQLSLHLKLFGVVVLFVAAIILVFWHHQAHAKEVMSIPVPKMFNWLVERSWPKPDKSPPATYGISIGASQIHPWGTLWREMKYPHDRNIIMPDIPPK